MKRYKSIFKESLSDEVDSRLEAKQIVDISSLQWGKTFKSDWISAESKCPSGWRLPTIQELYTAYKQGVEGFQSNLYWSSSTYAQNTNDAWFVDFYNGVVLFSGKTGNDGYVRCVRDI
jgi:hypothetical protein